MTSDFLNVKGLGMTFGGVKTPLEVLRSVSFSLHEQEFLCVVGPSGSGKSTLLRLIAGLLKPTQGKITFSGLASEVCVALVFQQANLMPWRTVRQNISLPLEMGNIPQGEADQQVDKMLDLIGLKEFEKSWPGELSGGMAQRVAIARALIQKPDLLLLDEPFGSLDALTRERMGVELLRIWQSQRTAVIMVTHSISEALLLSDRVLVLTPRPGQVVEDVKVSLTRPRSEELRYTTEFQAMERGLREMII